MATDALRARCLVNLFFDGKPTSHLCAPGEYGSVRLSAPPALPTPRRCDPTEYADNWRPGDEAAATAALPAPSASPVGRRGTSSTGHRAPENAALSLGVVWGRLASAGGTRALHRFCLVHPPLLNHITIYDAELQPISV